MSNDLKKDIEEFVERQFKIIPSDYWFCLKMGVCAGILVILKYLGNYIF